MIPCSGISRYVYYRYNILLHYQTPPFHSPFQLVMPHFTTICTLDLLQMQTLSTFYSVSTPLGTHSTLQHSNLCYVLYIHHISLHSIYSYSILFTFTLSIPFPKTQGEGEEGSCKEPPPQAFPFSHSSLTQPSHFPYLQQPFIKPTFTFQGALHPLFPLHFNYNKLTFVPVCSTQDSLSYSIDNLLDLIVTLSYYGVYTYISYSHCI